MDRKHTRSSMQGMRRAPIGKKVLCIWMTYKVGLWKTLILLPDDDLDSSYFVRIMIFKSIKRTNDAQAITMNTVPITLLFADGVTRRIPGQIGESVVQAATRAGLCLLTDCSNGQCGTCTATVLAGSLEMGEYDRAVLPDCDRADGLVLPCSSQIQAACTLEFPYDSTEVLAEEPPPVSGRIAWLTQVAAQTLQLDVTVDDPVHFAPGQYVRLRPQGAQAWRAYSMACISGVTRLTFYIRLVAGGQFSTWLSQATEGDALELSAPHGSFFLRDEPRPRLFLAGGTGLAPFLSMLTSIAQDPQQKAIPTTLLVGVRSGAHLFATEHIQALHQNWPNLHVHYAAEEDPGTHCQAGLATALLPDLDIAPETRVYLCGPPAMVEAARSAAQSAGLARHDILCERFT